MERPDLAKIDEDRSLAQRKWLACAGPTATLQDLPDYLKNLDIVITYCYHLESRVKMADTSAQELHAELIALRDRLSELESDLKAEVEGGKIAFGHVVEAKNEATKRRHEIQDSLDTSLQVIHRKNIEIAALKAENKRLQFEIDEHSFTPEPEEGPWS